MPRTNLNLDLQVYQEAKRLSILMPKGKRSMAEVINRACKKQWGV